MPSSEKSSASLPSVTVLLATRNGGQWLEPQLESIQHQQGVQVKLIVSDDASTDGTREWLLERAAADERLTVLPARPASGSAAANFYRLIQDAPIADDDLVAFSDQDDLWQPGKLARHAAILADGHDGVSSNVTAFTASGHRTLIRKDFPQGAFDYLLESPGPGSTFLMTGRLVKLVAQVLRDDDGTATGVDYHDWLVYAIARAKGWSWVIDSESTVDYRQHEGNVMGSNTGHSAALSRFQLIRQRWHRSQAARLARVGMRVVEPERRDALQRMLTLVESTRIRDRIALAREARLLRRRPRDQRIIGFLIWTGVW